MRCASASSAPPAPASAAGRFAMISACACRGAGCWKGAASPDLVCEVRMNLDDPAHAFRELVAVIKALRTPATGCPWDLEQTHATLRPFLLEEACEVLDALD